MKLRKYLVQKMPFLVTLLGSMGSANLGSFLDAKVADTTLHRRRKVRQGGHPLMHLSSVEPKYVRTSNNGDDCFLVVAAHSSA